MKPSKINALHLEASSYAVRDAEITLEIKKLQTEQKKIWNKVYEIAKILRKVDPTLDDDLVSEAV